MKKLKIFALAGVLLLVSAVTAQAAEFIAPDGHSGTVDVAASESHKNLHVAGGIVHLNGPITGDLIAAGGIVKISGNVEKGLIVAGGRISVDAAVGGNVHAAGGNLFFNQAIGGDLVTGGGRLELSDKASVSGDLVVGGGDVIINGKITGNVTITAKTLTFGPTSQVTGTVKYKGPEPAVVKEGAKVGVINYTQVSKGAVHKGGFFGLLIIGSLFKLLMLLAAGAVLAWLVPRKITEVTREALNRPWPSLGIGVLVLILSPVLAGLLMITVLGLYLGMMVFLVYGLMIIISTVLAMFYTGNLVWGWYKKDAEPSHWRDLWVGALVTLVLSLIPFVGWIAVAVLWLITLGSLTTHWRKEAQN